MTALKTRISALTAALLFAGALQAQTQIPYFAFKDLNGKTFTRDMLRQDLPVMIMLFDPFCDHCDQQAQWIAQAASKFQNVQLVFVTIETDKQHIEAYRKRNFGTARLPYLYLLQDTELKFDVFFGYTDDSLNIYLYKPGQKGKYFGQEQPAEVLLKYL
jgi:thiol-disulfide isomerase/thioredoxin